MGEDSLAMGFTISAADSEQPKRGGFTIAPAEEADGVNWQAAADTAIDTAKNIGAGALSGAARIGSTLLSLVPGTMPSEERRRTIGEFFRENADPSSNAFRIGETGGEIAGTAGVGGAIGKGIRTVGGLLAPTSSAIPQLASAVQSGGFQLGAQPAATAGGRVAQLLTRGAGGAITGGASAGLIDPETAGTGAAIGGALPAGVLAAGAAGRGIRNVVADEVSPAVAALYQKAKQYGIEIPADRLANSRPLNAVASSLDYVPLSGRTGSMDRMFNQFNTAISRTMGENTPNMTAALRQAETKLGAKFEQTLTQNGVVYDKPLLDSMVRNLDEARVELTEDQYKRIIAVTNDIFDKAKPTAGGGLAIDGQAAYNIKKMLDRMGNSADTSLAFHARELKRSLMDGLDRSLGTRGAADFAKLREQYGNMLTLQNMVPHGAEGSVSPARLASAKGLRGELSDLADIAGQFLKSREGQHGAMQRVFLGGGAGGLAVGAPSTIPFLAAGAAAGRATNAALNSNTVKDMLLRTGAQPNYRLLSDPAARTTIYDLISQSNRAVQQ